ncbi:hypothetical protein QVD17_30260 [Tagetes erecta]|uniref:Uncharacterized protein n=1 Tax=Tagetes erecta TaxID=13708 RepID=A0AAD8NM37_TARER|nr:hypothetical protein QVD17_30260 [Tagetes erecta]
MTPTLKTPSSPPQKPKQTPPSTPPTGGFVSPRIALVFPVIQEFKKKVTYDPLEVTKTWNGRDICQYMGLTCDTVPGTNRKGVTGVNFNYFNFSGHNLTLNDFITALPDIVYFHANSNNFVGSIPTDISKLKYLKDLDLSNNNFSGNFPIQVLNSHKLKFLDLRFNTFAGLIPPQIFQLNVDFLFINNNNFIQKIPDTIGLTKARYIILANNKFIGGIPPSIGNTSNTLLEILFLNNRLTGCLPCEIGLLKKTRLFDVESNYLTGPIPHSFQFLHKIEALCLARNNFYGMVPEAVCSLPMLFNFTLSYNYFTEVGPRCRELIKNGILDVKMNCIADFPDQKSSIECAFFFSKTHSCPNEKSFTCSQVMYSSAKLESSDVRFTAPATTPMQAPRWLSYDALFPRNVINTSMYN